MRTIKAHFNGTAIVPDEPVDLPLNEQFSIGIPDPPDPAKKYLTGAELVANGLMGGWEHRTDIPDSLEFARQLRERSNLRSL